MGEVSEGDERITVVWGGYLRRPSVRDASPRDAAFGRCERPVLIIRAALVKLENEIHAFLFHALHFDVLADGETLDLHLEPRLDDGSSDDVVMNIHAHSRCAVVPQLAEVPEPRAALE
jgi:hypothetical protein